MCDKKSDVSGKTVSLQNDYKNNLNDIDDDSDIFSILISSSSMMHLSVSLSLLSEKNLAHELASEIISSSLMQARITQVKTVYQINY